MLQLSLGREGSYLPKEALQFSPNFVISYTLQIKQIFENIKWFYQREKDSIVSWILTGSNRRMTTTNEEILPLWNLILCGEETVQDWILSACTSFWLGYGRLTYSVFITGQGCLHDERFLQRIHNWGNFDSQWISSPKFSRFLHASSSAQGLLPIQIMKKKTLEVNNNCQNQTLSTVHGTKSMWL